MSHLKSVDPEIFNLVKAEEKRQREVLEMIPSANYTSTVLSASTTVSFSSDTTATSMSHPNLTIGRINLDIIK